MNSSVRTFTLMVAAAVVGACGATDEVAVTPGLRPTQIHIVSGNQQSGNQQGVLQQPLVVTVTNDAGVPVPGVSVDWFVTAGGGAVSQQRTFTDANGQTSVVWALGAQSGSQSVAATVGSISTAAMFSATASTPSPTPPAPRILVLHYDGTTVTTQYIDNTANDQLSSVWGSSSSNVIALGYNGTGFELLYDGARWSKTFGTSVPGRPSAQRSISGTSASDIFAIKYYPKLPASPPPSTAILQYDGQSWKTAYTYAPATYYLSLNGIWARSPADIFAVGDSGYVARYNGANWSVTHTDTDENLFAVWADPSSSAAFAVGMYGAIVRFDGTAWHKMDSGTSDILMAVWGSSAHDVFVSTLHGGILHYDGTSWSSQISETPGVVLSALWGYSPTSVFAAGSKSTLLRYDGTSWTKIPVDVTINFCGVWGSSLSDVFAVGCGW